MNYNAMHSVPSWTLPFRWHDKRLSHPWGKLEHKDQEGQSRDSRGMLLLVGLSGIFNRSPNTTASACSGWIPSLLFSLLLSVFHVLFSLFSQFWRPAVCGLRGWVCYHSQRALRDLPVQSTSFTLNTIRPGMRPVSANQMFLIWMVPEADWMAS